MKIAFLSHLDMNLYLFRLPIMLELLKQGHEVYALMPQGDYFERFSPLGIHAIEYKIERSSTNPLKEIRAIKNIYNALKPLKVDILHTFTVKPNIYGSIAGKLLKIPVVVNAVTGLGSFYIRKSFKAKVVKSLIEILYRVGFAFAKGVVFQNSEDLELFVKKGLLPREKAHLIRGSGIDMEQFSPIQKEKGKNIAVLMIARAIWDKGVREYYEAASILKEKNFTFRYIGDIDRGNISSASMEFMQNGDVEYLGHRDDIREQIGMCDIFVLPSYREGLPRTLLEASAMQKAIVTTDTVGCREVVEDEVSGILVPLKDARSLSEAILKLAESKELREQYAQNAYLKCKNEFDVKIVVDKHLDLYKFYINTIVDKRR